MEASLHSPSKGPDGPAHANGNSVANQTSARRGGESIDERGRTNLCKVIADDTQAETPSSHRA